MTDQTVLIPAPLATATSLVDGIQAALRDAITRGILPPGHRLRVIPLAEHFGCSTTPVREAVRQLEHEGLVRIYPRRGAEVLSISSAEVEHLYETRIVLESYATKRAAQIRPSDAALSGARKVLKKQQQAIKSNARTKPLDSDFHRELTRLAGNPMIAELVERATSQIEAVQARNHSLVKGGLAHAYEAHTAILDAVANGNADEAEALMRDHLEWARKAVLESLADRQTAIPPRL